MKRTLLIPLAALLALAPGPARGQGANAAVEAKYSEPLRKIFDLQPRFSPLHPAFSQVYPVAIVENKTFYIFEPAKGEKTYRLARTAPDTFNMPIGIRAAMPLAFWDNRMACVVTGEIFNEPDGYVFIFHEFVHCAQWNCCETKLKEGLTIYRTAMKTKNYMWELQYPFPYSNPAFVETYPALFKAWEGNDGTAVESLTAKLKKALSPEEWEYLTWQEWKEGLARYLENRMRGVVGLPENKGGEKTPFSRVTFYRGGDLFIRFLERRTPGVSRNLNQLYALIRSD